MSSFLTPEQRERLRIETIDCIYRNTNKSVLKSNEIWYYACNMVVHMDDSMMLEQYSHYRYHLIFDSDLYNECQAELEIYHILTDYKD